MRLEKSRKKPDILSHFTRGVDLTRVFVLYFITILYQFGFFELEAILVQSAALRDEFEYFIYIFSDITL